MKKVYHVVWLARWLQRLTSAIVRRRKVIDLLPSFLAPRYRILFDTRTGRLHKFVLRKSLSDYWSYDQCLASGALDLERHPQGRSLRAHYVAMLTAGRTPAILDCGANIGCSTYWLANEFPKARILAVEPDTENAKLAVINTRHCPNVRVVQAAVASADFLLALANTDNGADAFRTELSASGTIAGYSIASLLSQIEAEPADLLVAKIDIEGFEQELFSRNTDWVDSAAAIIVETHDWMLPGQATATNLLRRLSVGKRDFLVDGESQQ